MIANVGVLALFIQTSPKIRLRTLSLPSFRG